jgi:hypothetical protein
MAVWIDELLHWYLFGELLTLAPATCLFVLNVSIEWIFLHFVSLYIHVLEMHCLCMFWIRLDYFYTCTAISCACLSSTLTIIINALLYLVHVLAPPWTFMNIWKWPAIYSYSIVYIFTPPCKAKHQLTLKCEWGQLYNGSAYLLHFVWIVCVTFCLHIPGNFQSCPYTLLFRVLKLLLVAFRAKGRRSKVMRNSEAH